METAAVAATAARVLPTTTPATLHHSQSPTLRHRRHHRRRCHHRRRHHYPRPSLRQRCRRGTVARAADAEVGVCRARQPPRSDAILQQSRPSVCGRLCGCGRSRHALSIQAQAIWRRFSGCRSTLILRCCPDGRPDRPGGGTGRIRRGPSDVPPPPPLPPPPPPLPPPPSRSRLWSRFGARAGGAGDSVASTPFQHVGGVITSQAAELWSDRRTRPDRPPTARPDRSMW